MGSRIEKKIIGHVSRLSGRKEKELNKGFFLFRDLPLDSLGVAELLAAIEDEFDVDVPTGYMPLTINDLIGFIETQC